MKFKSTDNEYVAEKKKKVENNFFSFNLHNRQLANFKFDSNYEAEIKD